MKPPKMQKNLIVDMIRFIMLKRNSTYVLELTFHSGRAYEGISYGRGFESHMEHRDGPSI